MLVWWRVGDGQTWRRGELVGAEDGAQYVMMKWGGGEQWYIEAAYIQLHR